jgi:hypothetical protein
LFSQIGGRFEINHKDRFYRRLPEMIKS